MCRRVGVWPAGRRTAPGLRRACCMYRFAARHIHDKIRIYSFPSALQCPMGKTAARTEAERCALRTDEPTCRRSNRALTKYARLSLDRRVEFAPYTLGANSCLPKRPPPWRGALSGAPAYWEGIVSARDSPTAEHSSVALRALIKAPTHPHLEYDGTTFVLRRGDQPSA